MDAQIGANSTGFTSFPINTDLSILEETGSESQYANLLASSNQDLHTASIPQISGEVQQKEQGENHLNSPGCLPEYNTIYKPSMINWPIYTYKHFIYTLQFIIIINLHSHKVHFRPQMAGASRGGWR